MKEEFSQRLIEFVHDLILDKAYKSERDFLKQLGFSPDKFANVRKNKSYFTLDDIGVILTHHPELDVNWLLGVEPSQKSGVGNLQEALGIIQKLTDVIATMEAEKTALMSLLKKTDVQQEGAATFVDAG